MKEITAIDKPKKTSLPEGKSDLTEAESRALLEHCKKLIRDGLISRVWSTLNLAAACFNFKKFRLYLGLYDSFEDAVYDQFGFTRRTADRYADIGERLSDVLGGGCITQRMIEARMEKDVWESRLGFRQIQTLARTSEGVARLLDAKSEQDVQGLLDDLKTGAQAIRDEMDSKPKTALKSALSKKYDEMRPPTQTELNILFAAVTRQVEEINSKYLSRLRSACRALADGNSYSDSVKFPKKATRMWGAIREMHDGLRDVARHWPDMAAEAERVIALVRAIPAELAGDTDTLRQEIDRARVQRQARRTPEPKLPKTFKQSFDEVVPMSEEEADALLNQIAPHLPEEYARNLPDPKDHLSPDYDDNI